MADQEPWSVNPLDSEILFSLMAPLSAAWRRGGRGGGGENAGQGDRGGEGRGRVGEGEGYGKMEGGGGRVSANNV